jgi:hypothetical protein
MVQVWVLNRDTDPVTALKNGESKKICFDCTHLEDNTCYVNVGQAPLSVWRSYKKGNYEPFNSVYLRQALHFKSVRFGAYGEPVLIPLPIVEFMVYWSKSYTGYTHQYNNKKYAPYRKFFMASADTKKDVEQANKKNWRTFRVSTTKDTRLKNELVCPNITNHIQCINCKLCNGYSKAKNIVVPVHGTKGIINKFNLVTL